MTPSERKAARKRCEAATAGPWRAREQGWIWQDGTALRLEGAVAIVTDPDHPSSKLDGNFIAHARTDLPKALDQIDADERLMRDAVAVLVDLGACDDPECREPNCIHFLPRLRTRIGQKQEADDERE